jgi:uncharacterized repeat protein (TIGR01451 family)
VTSLVSLQTNDERQERSATINVLPPEVPRLVVEVTGPKHAHLTVGDQGPAPGKPIPLQVTVRNLGTGPSREAVVHASLEGGLQHHSQRQKLDTPIGPIAPGEARPLPLELLPVQAGPAIVRVWIESEGQTTQPVVHEILVRAPTLGLRILGERTALVGKPITWELEVSNHGTAPVSNVTVQDRLPPGVELTQASGNATRQNGEVTWVLGTLMPGKQQRLQLTATPKQLGEKLLHEARVTGSPDGEALPVSGHGHGMEVYASTEFAVIGLPAVKLQVRDNVDPVTVGGPTTYRIDVTNQGSSPVANLSVTAALPNQMKFVGVRGTTQFKQNDLSLTFAPIGQLMPGQTVTYFIDVTALIPGEARLHVELLGGPVALVQEESTTIR